MLVTNNIFMRIPGDDFGTGGIVPDDSEISKTSDEEPVIKKDDGEKKPFMDKVRQALQDWSNDDQADTAYDDSHPLSSNL